MTDVDKDLKIVYQDENFFAVNKPSGIAVHKTGPNDPNLTLVDLILEKFPEIKNVGDSSTGLGQMTLRPGIVHRLDKETSGLMLVARNQESFNYLKNLFQKRLIQKTYLALVYGKPNPPAGGKKGVIDLPLGKIGTKQTIRIKGKKELKEREAVTEYKIIREFTDYSLLEIYPKTGRTHQVRTHLNSIGHPVVCDPIYGGRKKYCPPELGRLFLHAQKLEFTSPSGQRLHLEVELPNELTSFLNSLTIFP